MAGEYNMLGSGTKKHVVLLILVTLFLAIFIVLATPARSFTTQSVAVDPVRQAATDQQLKSHDACAALLNDGVLKQGTRSPAPHPAVLREEASPAAALSLLLGVRYAVGPTEAPTPTALNGQRGLHYGAESGAALHPDLSGQRALAVAQYRSCRNAQLLRAL